MVQNIPNNTNFTDFSHFWSNRQTNTLDKTAHAHVFRPKYGLGVPDSNRSRGVWMNTDTRGVQKFAETLDSV